MQEIKNRVEKWDNVKFVLIFFVVLGHLSDLYIDKSGVCKTISYFIYSFHMPAFIFVSGLFSKKTVQNKRYDKIAPFLVLHLVLKAALSISDGFLYGKMSFSLFDNPGLPWYVLALFVFYLLTILFRKISPVYVLAVSLLLSCIVGYDFKIDSMLSLSRIIVFYPFFYLGYLCDPSKLEKVTSKPIVKIVSAVVLVAFAGLVVLKLADIYYLRFLFVGKVGYKSLSEELAVYGGLFRLGWYVVAGIISFCVIALVPRKLPTGIIARFGSRSIQTYSLHYLFLKALYYGIHIDKVYERFSTSRTWIIIFPIAVVLTVLCSLKIWEPIFNFILKPKKIKNQDSEN